jgi:hypothetical protein
MAVVDQICNANESEGGLPIVIMAEIDKQEMEEALAKHDVRLRGSRVICRRGTQGRCAVLCCAKDPPGQAAHVALRPAFCRQRIEQASWRTRARHGEAAPY